MYSGTTAHDHTRLKTGLHVTVNASGEKDFYAPRCLCRCLEGQPPVVEVAASGAESRDSFHLELASPRFDESPQIGFHTALIHFRRMARTELNQRGKLFPEFIERLKEVEHAPRISV